ncbi:Flp family type IVb pilin [Parvibaculum sp.]
MKDESGISAVEYGLLAAGIAVGLWAIVGGDTGIGTSLQAVLGDVQTDLATAAE